jgi:hypothetical protein
MDTELYSFDVVGEWQVVVEASGEAYEGIAFKVNPNNPSVVVTGPTGEQTRLSVLKLLESEG